MNTNDYFLKLSEYCNFNIDCIDKTLSDKKKLRKILDIENRRELDNIQFDISTNFDKYVYKNYKKFPKDEVAKFIAVNMCGYDFKCMLEQLQENGIEDMLGYVVDYLKRNKDEIIEFIIVNKCNYDFKCILENLKESNMQDMLDYVLDYLKRNYDIENIVNTIIDALSVISIPDGLELFGNDSFVLPVIGWLEFPDREQERVVLMNINTCDIPELLSSHFDEMRADYLLTYEEVFGEASDDIVNKIEETIDEIHSRAEERFTEIAKNIYNETLELINNNPEYEIVDYVDCDTRMCYLLGLDKIPVVRISENRKEYLLNL